MKVCERPRPAALHPVVARLLVLVLALGLPAVGAPVADRGTVDLRAVDFSGNVKIPLSGEWEFEHGAWKEAPAPLQSRATLPHRWSRSQVPLYGRATYRLRLHLPPPMGEPWALSLNDANVFHAPLRIMANGRLIHENSSFTGAPGGEWVALPEGPEIVLEFFLDNALDSRGGRLDAPILAPQSRILLHSQNRISNKLFSLGMMTLGAVLFLFFFAMMPSRTSSLYFALFCLSMIARTLSTQERIFDHTLPFLNHLFWNRMEQFGFFMTVLFFLLYLFSLFPGEGWRLPNRFIIAATAVFVVLAAFLPITWVTRLVDPFQALALVCGAYSILVLARAIHHKREGAWLLLGGFLVIFLTVINDILFAKSLLQTGLFSPYAVSFFVVVMGILLVYRHVRRIREVRESTAEAMKAREDLLTNQAEMMRLEAERLYRDDATGLSNLARFEGDLARHPEAGFGAIEFTHWGDHLRFFGASASAQLVKAAARNLVSFAAPHQIEVYRLSASRFGLRFPRPLDEAEALSLSREIATWVAQPVPLGQTVVSLQGFTALTSGADRFFEKINRALEGAEDRGSGYQWCTAGTDEEDLHRRNLAMTRELAEALPQGRIKLHFQPILDNRSFRFDKHEALVRLLGRDGTLLSPAAFLPAARAGNLYGAVTREVLRLAREHLSTLQGRISINVSNRDLHDPETCLALTDIMGHPEAGRIIFEMLESDGMGDYERAIQFIAEAKSHGCRVAIDDFGSGYSNFEHLLRMKVDIIKIDGSLIKNLDTDRQARILVEQIVHFSEKLGMETVAEFVHNDRVFDTVRAMGIHYSQGYHLSPPTATGLSGQTFPLPSR